MYPFLAPHQRPLEHIQSAGEIVFLPSRWWHMVLNCSDTVAVTQNFVPLSGLEGSVQDLAWGSGSFLQPQASHTFTN